MGQIPGMLSTSYRCLQCKKDLKKSEIKSHSFEFPDHTVYKTKQEVDFEIIKESPKLSIEQSIDDLEKLRQENKILRKHIQEEILAMELLTLKLQRIRRMYESTIQ